jgi:hypothetical protein
MEIQITPDADVFQASKVLHGDEVTRLSEFDHQDERPRESEVAQESKEAVRELEVHHHDEADRGTVHDAEFHPEILHDTAVDRPIEVNPEIELGRVTQVKNTQRHKKGKGALVIPGACKATPRNLKVK